MKDLRFVFFGTPDRAVFVLDELKKSGLMPSIVITQPDKPVGRRQLVTAPPVKVWAQENSLERLYQPENKKELSVLGAELAKEPWDIFLVVAYGMMIPNDVLEIPKHGAINVHYSLLPKLRGASPVVQQILAGEKETGLSIVEMVEALDAGPVIYIEKMPMPEPLPTTGELARILSIKAGQILPEVLERWIAGEIKGVPQDEEQATFCSKIKKEDTEINLLDDPLTNWRKIQAYQPWPQTFFFVEKEGKKTRVKINEAKWENDTLQIRRVTPEGKKEIDFETFKNNHQF